MWCTVRIEKVDYHGWGNDTFTSKTGNWTLDQ